MQIPEWLLAILALATVAIWVVRERRRRRVERRRFVRGYRFPDSVDRRLAVIEPDWTAHQREQAWSALREFFIAWQRSDGRRVALPSRSVERAWRAFANETSAYADFCKAAFGQPIEPLEAQPFGQDPATDEALRRCWWQTCRDQRIDPRRPGHLPLLFAVDFYLMAIGGLHYTMAPPRDDRGDDGITPVGLLGDGDPDADRYSAADGDAPADGDGGHDGGGDGD